MNIHHILLSQKGSTARKIAAGLLAGLSFLGISPAYAGNKSGPSLTVTTAKLNAAGNVEVHGTATPRAIIHWENGPVARADDSGQFSFESEDLVPDNCVGELREGNTRIVVSLADCLPEPWQPQDFIVVFDESEIKTLAKAMRAMAKLSVDDRTVLDMKAREYAKRKQGMKMLLKGGGAKVLHEYSHLPMMAVRVDTPGMLEAVKHHPGVIGVYKNRQYSLQLAQSLPLIGQPAAASTGATGTGTTVAVLDTGVDYNQPSFGNCTGGIGTNTCRVVAAQDFAPNDGVLDADGHGTHVAETVLGVAPNTRIIAFDVFNGKSSSDSYLVTAINTVIQKQGTFASGPVVAINLSLGESTKYVAECPNGAFLSLFANLRAAGILPVVASGNEGFTDGMVFPACVAGAFRVGSTQDSGTTVDQVSSFSNSAWFLSLVAPGQSISVPAIFGSWFDRLDYRSDGFITMSGTSMAAPHVVGAVAALHQVNPQLTADEIGEILRQSGKRITDKRNNLTFPRLNLGSAVTMARLRTMPGLNNPIGVTGIDNGGDWEVGDFNGDGRSDLFFWWKASGTNRLFLGTGTGSFTPMNGNVITAAGIIGGPEVKVGDFNGDGRSDLFFWWKASGDNQLYLGTGTGTFTPMRANVIGITGIDGGDAWMVGDFNGDGRSDLFFWWKVSGTNNLYLGTSTGSFMLVLNPLRVAADNGYAWTVGDFNGDGRSDLFFWWKAGANRLFLGTSTGSFTLMSGDVIPATGMDGGPEVKVGDFNGDGRSDLFLWWKQLYNGNNRLHLSNGNGTFSQVKAPIGLELIDGGDEWTVGDFNGDGRSDLFFWWKTSGTNRLYLGNGTGSFTPVFNPIGVTGIDGGMLWMTGDFTGDRRTDLFFWWYTSGTNRLYLGAGM